MKIIVNQEPQYFEDIQDEETCNYSLNAVYGIPDDVTATEAATVFFKAMITAGYCPKSIIQAFVDVANYQLDCVCENEATYDEYESDYDDFDDEEYLEFE